MKASTVALVSLFAMLALAGCDEVEELRGVGAQKGAQAGGESAPLDDATRKALGKRAMQQNFGL